MLLFTGFDPFDGAGTNPTQRLVEHVASLRLPHVAAQVLPTSYRRAEHELADAIRKLRPHTVCMLGLHGGAATLRFEQVALNLNQANKPDNDGDVRLRQHIHETGPVGYFSELPFEPMQQLALVHGETLELSRDAGGFVCNHVFYTVSALLTRELPQSRAGFVHVPHLDELRFERVCHVVEGWLDMLTSAAPAS